MGGGHSTKLKHTQKSLHGMCPVELLSSSYFSLFPGNGYIEGKELDDFLKEFVSSVNVSDVGQEVRRETAF